MNESNTENNSGNQASVGGVLTVLLILCVLMYGVATAYLGKSPITRLLQYGESTTVTETAEPTTKESPYRQDLIEKMKYVDAVEHPASSAVAPVWEVTDREGFKKLIVGGITAGGEHFRWITNPYWEEDIKTAKEFCEENHLEFVGWSTHTTIPAILVNINDQSYVSPGWSESFVEGTYQLYKGKTPGTWGSVSDTVYPSPGYVVYDLYTDRI